MSFYNRPHKEDRLPPSNHVRFLVACFAAVFCIAAPVFAQSTPKAEDRISFTFTAGSLRSTDCDPCFNGPVFGGSTQVVLKRWLVLDGDIGRWSAARAQNFTNMLAHAPNGTTLRIATTSLREDVVGWNAGATVLFRTTQAKWKVFGGIGVGMFWQNYGYESTSSGCVPASTLFCGTFPRRESTNGPVPGTQLVLGAEARVLDRLWVFATLRGDGRGFDEVPAGRSLRRVAAGVRVIAK
jgi:hypothetical protein